jgi:SAM-dependent methyltransferase
VLARRPCCAEQQVAAVDVAAHIIQAEVGDDPSGGRHRNPAASEVDSAQKRNITSHSTFDHAGEPMTTTTASVLPGAVLPDRQQDWRDQGAVGDRGLVTDDYVAAPPASDASSTGDGYVGSRAVQAEWDRRYAERDQLWSGLPNGALVAEVAGLTPGRVLDVGCGEGADAIWLAGGGWDVTALEVSSVALERAAGHARAAGVAVQWLHAELVDAALPPGSFTLVSAQYPALLRTPDAAAERALLAAVAPNGVLLLVHHAGMETEQMDDGGFDPADYVWPSMVAALLNDDWDLELYEQRPRIAPDGGAGAHHTEDLVLRARRLR